MSTLEDTNKDLIRRYQAAYNSNNLDALDALISTELKTPALLPGFGAGLEGLKQLQRVTLDAWPDLKGEIEDLVAEGEYVAARLTYSATPQKPAFGVTPTGKSFRISGQFIARIVSGKIVEHFGIEDAVGIMQQLGLMPAPGAEGL